jgi:hypothetical protein
MHLEVVICIAISIMFNSAANFYRFSSTESQASKVYTCGRSEEPEKKQLKQSRTDDDNYSVTCLHMHACHAMPCRAVT